MIITRKKKIPLHWAFYAQVPLLLTIYGDWAIHTPFLLLIKRFIDNPAAIMGLISLEIYITFLGGPLLSWLSDRIWTRWGRRKHFLVIGDLGRGLCLLAMPFAPNLVTLIIIRWIYGALSDFGSMTQALIYEVVPAPQRGRLSGFFQSSVQLSNILFYFLLIGRFDDLYFMGPLSFLGSLSGGAILFAFAALALLWVSVYEGLAIKEIKPPDIVTLADGRKEGESVIRLFIRTFLKDVLGKDFLPLYLLVFIHTMFSVSLGLFQPLLYTEQWGYSLQEMGTNIAIGAVFSIAFALTSGWFADRFGKLATFVISVTGSLITNIAFTIYVYYLPDKRPSLTELVVIGNIHNAFNMVKSVVVFPLIMEYVKRNRMGAANAGIKLFGALFRNTIVFFVGVWLAWWSAWFLPQAGYHLTATFPSAIEQNELKSLISDSSSDAYTLRPELDFGHTSESSMKWWIHQDDERTGELIKEQKDLKAKLSSLENKLGSPFLSEEERAEIEQEHEKTSSEIAGIQTELDTGAENLKQSLLPLFQEQLFPPGKQIIATHFSDGALTLEVQTISQLESELYLRFIQTLDSPQFEIIQRQDPDDKTRWQPNIEIQPGNDSLVFNIGYDSNYLQILNSGNEPSIDPTALTEIATSVVSVLRMELGRGNSRFEIVDSSLTTSDSSVQFAFQLRLLENALKSDPSPIALSLQQERAFDQVSAVSLQDGILRFSASISDALIALNNAESPSSHRLSEATKRINQLSPSNPATENLIANTYLQVAETLGSAPFYTSVPENFIQSGYGEREYEYFFSSKTLEICTDFIGYLIIFLLIYLERRGKIHRLGVEEDANR